MCHNERYRSLLYGRNDCRHASAGDSDRTAAVSLRRSVIVNVAPPSGLFCAPMVPPCASTMLRTIVKPIPRPCDFSVTNGVNSVPDVARYACSRVAHGHDDIRGLTSLGP